MMTPPYFEFHGQLPSSKSLWNRALILQSFAPEGFEIFGHSASKDIDLLQRALTDFKNGKTQFFCGDGGTTFRFLVLRLSREKGAFEVSGSKRLFSRPQGPLKDILDQLGVKSQWGPQKVILNSEGWKKTEGLEIRGSESSQFASGLLLAGYKLSRFLSFTVEKEIAEYQYFQMTLDFMKEMGISVERKGNQILLPSESCVQKSKYAVEPDMSSAFPLACLGALNGSCVFEDFPKTPLQPDFRFVSLLKDMGAQVSWKDSSLFIEKAQRLKPLQVDLLQTPDLFPVLVSALAFCEGSSTLSGLDRLQYKESHRAQKMVDLLQAIGFQCHYQNHCFTLEGVSDLRTMQKRAATPSATSSPSDAAPGRFVFECDEDHRLAMAASILQWQGVPLEIQNPQVVEKSFSGYFEILERARQ
jgi:3-phosphoshikimate 1-carboxyvinyltransferase